MSDMKCPFCQQKLHKDPDGYYTCYTDNCGCWANGGNGASGSESLWLTLIRTRKALDAALFSLQDIAESDGDFITGASTPLDEHEYADMMLKEIKRKMKIKTALEQKDVK